MEPPQQTLTYFRENHLLSLARTLDHLSPAVHHQRLAKVRILIGLLDERSRSAAHVHLIVQGPSAQHKLPPLARLRRKRAVIEHHVDAPATVQCGRLWKERVVADAQSKATAVHLEQTEPIAGRDHLRLGVRQRLGEFDVGQVQLAVGGQQLAASRPNGGRVEETPVGGQLGYGATDDADGQLGGQAGEHLARWSAGNRFGVFAHLVVQVGRIEEFGKCDDARPVSCDRMSDEALSGGQIGWLVESDDRLAERDADGRCVVL